MGYSLDGLHFLLIGIFAVGSSNFSIAFGVEFWVLVARSVAVRFEESEGGEGVRPSQAVLVEDGLGVEHGGGFLAVGDVFEEGWAHFVRFSKWI